LRKGGEPYGLRGRGKKEEEEEEEEEEEGFPPKNSYLARPHIIAHLIILTITLTTAPHPRATEPHLVLVYLKNK
jgi:hypothetical protein